MKRLLFLVGLGILGAGFIRLFVIEGIYLASDSMVPTLKTGDHVFVNKFVYFLKEPKRGEIVVFKTPQGPDKGLVKRVIAVGGDTIAIKNKKVILNREPLEERYVQYVRPNTILRGDNLNPIEIPPGYLFVMGDNRDESRDSRDWEAADGSWSPYVPLSAIKGRVILLK